MTISNETKNNLSITNESKARHNDTWDEATYTWDEAEESTWNLQRLVIKEETKNNLSITNESKN